ncbi:MAG: acetoacetate decarboxylase family protein [Candidatus Heimdallarchaeota archaeon]|nr:acetoacetate decarboxylase family protein [Candidatus Heimdallarchaeota archaeon]
MDTSSEDPFFNVTQTSTECSAGKVDLPILYYEVSNVIAFFRCNSSDVKTQLQGTPYYPAFKLFGKNLVGLSFYEYRKTGVGLYNEVGLAIPVTRDIDKKPFSCYYNGLIADSENRKVGYYILDLPVTTEIAWSAGRELWGYPKFVTDIPFSLDNRKFSSSVLDPHTNQPILSMTGNIGRGIPMIPLNLVLYSILNGDELRTVVNVRGGVTLSGSGSCKLSVGESDHPMAIRLRDLGLNNSKPILMTRTTKFQSRLNAGKYQRTLSPSNMKVKIEV